MTDQAPSLNWLEGGDLLSVPGWRGAAVKCGIKPSGGFDLAILQAPEARPAAALFTKNALPAACVTIGRETLAKTPRLRTIAVNAGNANAMTGSRGYEGATEMQRAADEACGGPALALSTGVIGVPLPVEKVKAGIEDAATSLAESCPEVADAILTTDTCRKTCAVDVELPGPSGGVVRVGGLAKGSGMIHPNMATMLAFVATDAPVEAQVLRGVLERATEASFHEITVDGDTSTNDAVVLVGGPDGASAIGENDERLPALEHAITEVMRKLARDIVVDGEGRTRIMEFLVEGAASLSDARAIAEKVTGSSLVKTALAGGDPNWGRIVAAAANAGVELDGNRIGLELCGIQVLDGGLPTEIDTGDLDERFGQPEVRAVLTLGLGEHRARRWTTDLSVEYVRINSEYTT